jgi:hypothetical protein
VLGTKGVTVDGCKVLPSRAGSTHTTVPLTNQSTFVIHDKTFLFEYPPKHLRPALQQTPHRKSRKSLRLSMIQSAVVFSPQKPTSRELDVAFLQSPVKPYKQSAVRDDRETEVTLVDGDAVVMAEEGKDAFFLEEVDRVSQYIQKPVYCR